MAASTDQQEADRLVDVPRVASVWRQTRSMLASVERHHAVSYRFLVVQYHPIGHCVVMLWMVYEVWCECAQARC